MVIYYKDVMNKLLWKRIRNTITKEEEMKSSKLQEWYNVELG